VMDAIVGIDLGTTNSAISIVKDGKPVILKGGDQSSTLPSVVGFSSDGKLLVGETARNQALVAPERTVKSIKRAMGGEEKVQLGDREYSPQEISAMIVRKLKDQAEQQLGEAVSRAVITVPAYFNENQREATREAGELAGFDVARIINEPTAATLAYEPQSTRNERLLIYDLGGGTFDVSIVQIEAGVIEVLASHGDTHLGGDDFDALLLDHVCEQFENEHGIDLRNIPVARSRLLQAVERAKQELSDEAVVDIAEEFIAEKDGKPLNLLLELDRRDYEEMIRPLLEKTIACVDAALTDANMQAADIDRVILVGGSSRTPLVHHLLKEQLHHDPHLELDPDLCVAMGAAVQGGLIAGIDVGAVLVDITPHTLGIQCLGELDGRVTPKVFSPLIERNTALPATRSEIYHTCYPGQDAAEIHVYQGEHKDVSFNQSVGQFMLEGLNEEANEGNEILVRFDLDLDGILTVTAVERETNLEKQLRLENAITQFRADSRQDAQLKLASVFEDMVEGGSSEDEQPSAAGLSATAEHSPLAEEARQLLAKASEIKDQAASEDAEEIQELMQEIQRAAAANEEEIVHSASERLEDLLFYVEDA
ncbi:MAG: Hsp70 family protein, partial [Planctomycetota bacterium]